MQSHTPEARQNTAESQEFYASSRANSNTNTNRKQRIQLRNMHVIKNNMNVSDRRRILLTNTGFYPQEGYIHEQNVTPNNATQHMHVPSGVLNWSHIYHKS